jgi:hypothetical protein
VLGKLGRAELPKATLDVMRAETGKLFARKQAVEASFTRQPGLLVIPLGVAYDPGKTTTADVTLPNPFGGDLIPATAEFARKTHDPATGLATRPTHVHTRAVGRRPFVELEPTDHLLAVEQREGITQERVREIAELVLHGQPHG